MGNWKRRTDLTVREVEGELLVLDLGSGEIHQLNRTASYIWHRCDGETSRAEIAGMLAKDFEVDHHIAEADVAAILDQLRELKVLVAVEDAETGHLEP